MNMNLSSTFTPAQLAAYNAAGNVLSGNLQRRVSGYDNDYLMKVLGQVGLTNDFSQADPTLLALMGQTANLPQVSSYLQQAGATPMTNSTNNMGMSSMMNPAMMQQMMQMYGMGAPAPAPASSGFDMSSMFGSMMSNMMGTNANPMSMFSGGIPSAQSNPMASMMQMFGMAPPPAPAPANPMAAMMQMFGMAPPPAPASTSPFAGLDSSTMASMFGQAPSMDPMSMMMNMIMGGGGASQSPSNMMMTMMMTMFSSFMQMIQARMQPQQPVIVEVPDPPAPAPVAVKPTPKPSPKPLPKPTPAPVTPPVTDPDNSAELAALLNDLFGGSLVL